MVNQRLLVAGAFLIRDDHVLLALHQQSEQARYYSLIGGKIELGESIHAGLIREIYEEVGIAVKSEDMQFIHAISLKNDDTTELTSFDFIIRKWEGEPINKEPLKHEHLAWFSLRALPDQLLDRHKKSYALFEQGIYYSYYGW